MSSLMSTRVLSLPSCLNIAANAAEHVSGPTSVIDYLTQSRSNFFQLGCGPGKPTQGRIAVDCDGCQRLFELVSDGGRHFADCGQPRYTGHFYLHGPQRILTALAFSDIDCRP